MLASLVGAASTFMPFPGTDIAVQVDQLYGFLLVASFISFVILIGGMIYFVIKYKRKSANDKTPYISHNHTLEFLWSFIPFVIFMVVFAWGWHIYHQMRAMPKDAFEVHVQGQKWSWVFNYKSGKTSSGGEGLVVPAGVPVKLIMTSVDVLHSFYIPAFRIKQDLIPGRYTTLWFEAKEPGEYQVFCAEYCGAMHSGMLTKVVVKTKAEFESWLTGEEMAVAGGKELTMPEKGQKLFNERGCVACHNTDKNAKIGPGLAGVFGHSVQLEGGSQVTADEAYMRESILQPQAKIVKGFAGQQMTPYQGQLKEEELAALIEFLKTLK